MVWCGVLWCAVVSCGVLWCGWGGGGGGVVRWWCGVAVAAAVAVVLWLGDVVCVLCVWLWCTSDSGVTLFYNCAVHCLTSF